MGPLTQDNLRHPLVFNSRVWEAPALQWPWGAASVGQKTPEGGERPHGSQKRQRSPGGTLGGGHSKRPKHTGQLSYARAAQEGVRVAIVCEGYTGDHISRDNFVEIQRAVGGCSTGRGCHPQTIRFVLGEGAAIMVYQHSDTKEWLESQTPTMEAREGSRLKFVGIGCSYHIQENGGQVSGPPGGHGAAFLAAPWTEPGIENGDLESIRAQGGTECSPPCTQCRLSIRHRAGGTSMETLQWCRAGCLLPSRPQA